MKYLKTYENITKSYLQEDSADPSHCIEGFIIFKDHLIEYDVEYHEDFGYSINSLVSDELIEDDIDYYYDEIKEEVIKDIKSFNFSDEKEKEKFKKELEDIRIKKSANKYNI